MIKNLLNKYREISIPIRASIWFIVCSFLQQGISLITTPIFTRLLTTDEYGKYTIYNSWLGIFSIIVTFKLSEAVFNKSMIVTEKDNRRTVLSSFQLLVSLLWILCFVLYLIFHRWINLRLDMNSTYMILMFAEIFLTATISLWTSYQRFEYNYRLLIIITLLLAILNPVLGIIIIKYSTNRAIGRISGIVLSQFLIAFFLFFYNIRYFQVNNLIQNWKYALSFNLPLIPHYLSQIFLSQGDRIMIGRLIGTSEAALYGVAYTIGMLGTMVTHSITNAYVPWMYRKLKQKNYNEIISNNFILLYILDICIIIIFIIAPEAMYIIGGDKYIEATVIIYPVAISVSFMFIYGLFANIEYYFEKRIYVMIGTCISSILNWGLNSYFLPIYGYHAAAYTTLFCYFCYGAFHIFIVPRIIYNFDKTHVDIPFLKITGASLGLILFSIIIQYLIPYPIIRYSILLILIGFLFIKRKNLFQYFQTITDKK